MLEANRHLERVDILRAVAILLVFVYHQLGFAFGAYTFPWQGLWMDLSAAPHSSFYLFYPVTLFWTGVPLFFIISGFCIHHSVLKSERPFCPSDFLWRRFWRIYPAYIVCLGILTAVQHRGASQADSTQVLTHLFLVHNLHQDTIFGINIPFWSLATEAQLYLFYPLFLYTRNRKGIWKALQTVLLVSLLGRVFATLWTNWHEDLMTSVWQSPVILWLDWCLGALIADLYHTQKCRACGSRNLLIGAGLIFVVSTFCKFTATFSFTLASLFWGLVLMRCLASNRTTPRWCGRLIPVGLCSYSLYLWHFPIQRQTLHALAKLGLPLHPVAVMSIGLLLSFAVAFLFSWCAYKLIELPGLALGRRLRICRKPDQLPELLLQKQKS